MRRTGTLDDLMRPVVLVVLLCLAVACSPPASPPTTPSTTTSEVVTTTTTTLSPAESSAAFVDCLRGESIDVADVAVDAQGSPRLGELAETLDTTDGTVRTAIVECATLLSTAQMSDLAADPEVRLLVEEQLRTFAQCMRDEGVEGFPDPTGDSLMGGSPYPLEAVPFFAPGFGEALATCQAVIGSFGIGG